MIQLTEQEVNKLIGCLELHRIKAEGFIDDKRESWINTDYIISKWKEKGFTKKSKLEEARAKISNIKLNTVESKIVELYEEAIKEIMEDKNE